jgi:hypothetical protein
MLDAAGVGLTGLAAPADTASRECIRPKLGDPGQTGGQDETVKPQLRTARDRLGGQPDTPT